MAKPTRTAAQLQETIQQRINDIPELAGGSKEMQGSTVVWKDPGFGGCNWTLRMVRNPDSYSPHVAGVIRAVQAEFDLQA